MFWYINQSILSIPCKTSLNETSIIRLRGLSLCMINFKIKINTGFSLKKPDLRVHWEKRVNYITRPRKPFNSRLKHLPAQSNSSNSFDNISGSQRSPFIRVHTYRAAGNSVRDIVDFQLYPADEIAHFAVATFRIGATSLILRAARNSRVASQVGELAGKLAKSVHARVPIGNPAKTCPIRRYEQLG